LAKQRNRPLQLVREEEAAKHPARYLDGYPEMLMDDEVAIVSQEDFDRLSDYSASIPTGVCDGKVWKALVYETEKRGFYKLRFFEKDEADQHQCFVRQRRLIILGSVEFWDWLRPGIWDG
jgi:hypothetical protein